MSFYLSLACINLPVTFLTFHLILFQDFWIQTIHHVVTISLLFFSFSTNFFRVGAVILLIHDVSDVFLEVKIIIKTYSTVYIV